MTARHRLTADDLTVTPQAVHARSILADIDRDRLAIKLLHDGLTQDVVAKELHVSQATVHRIAKRAHDIEQAEPTPIEVIARYCIGQIGHEQMLGDLTSRDFTLGFTPEGGYDAYVRGSWDDVEFAHASGMLSDSDFEVLLSKLPA